MEADPLRIVGAPGSPYSRKLRAVLRYRRIPHVWLLRGAPEARGLPRPRVELLPQLVAHLAPQGVLIASGIIEPRAAEVVDAMRGAGLAVAQRRDDGEWVSLRLERAG